jgi:hypothetical protein
MLLTQYIKGRKIILGTLEKGVFIRKVNKSKHLFRKLNAWGFDYNIFTNVILPQCNFIIIYEREEKVFYATMPSVLGRLESGKFIPSSKVSIRHYNKNIEEGTQIFLPLRYFWQSKMPMSIERLNELNKANLTH